LIHFYKRFIRIQDSNEVGWQSISLEMFEFSTD